MRSRLRRGLLVAMIGLLSACNSGVPEPAATNIPGTDLRLTLVRVATDPFLSRHNLTLMIERAGGCAQTVDLFPDTGHASRRNVYVTAKALIYVVGQFDARVIDAQQCSIALSEFRHLDREVMFVGSFDENADEHWDFVPAAERPERSFEKR
ncbi:MAG: conserved exported protein of unknown function [Nitrospira sp.]|nr:MAG: conserved exported protein of unknown function [Nitrospira sp.]